MATAASGGDRMTYEEAIKHFKSLQKRYTKEHNGRMCEKVNLALEALEKQIPKKPIIRETEDYFGYVRYILCPNCKEIEFGHEHPCFCKLCGQAIDWEEN